MHVLASLKLASLVFRLPFVYKMRQPEKGFTTLWLALSVALTMRFVPAGHFLFFASPKKRKQKKSDPDVQACCADFPHSASFFRRVRTSRAMRVVEQAHAFSRNKESCVRLDVGERVAALNICDGLGSLERAVVWETACVAKPYTLLVLFIFSGCLG